MDFWCLSRQFWLWVAPQKHFGSLSAFSRCSVQSSVFEKPRPSSHPSTDTGLSQQNFYEIFIFSQTSSSICEKFSSLLIFYSPIKLPLNLINLNWMLKADIRKWFIFINWLKGVSFLWISGPCQSPWESDFWVRFSLLKRIILCPSSNVRQRGRKCPGNSQTCTWRTLPSLTSVYFTGNPLPHHSPLSSPGFETFCLLR